MTGSKLSGIPGLRARSPVLPPAFRLLKVSGFLREVSQSPWLKFDLAWLSFVGLALPTALLMSLGVSEMSALPLMLVATLPFQYAAFCFLRWLKEAPKLLPVDEYLRVLKSDQFSLSLRLVDELAEREDWSFRDWKDVRNEFLQEMLAKGRADLTTDEIHDRFKALIRRRHLEQPELFR